MCLIELLKPFVQQGDFTLRSGQKSNYYINLKNAMLNGAILQVTIQEICEKLTYFNAIGGPTIGSDAIVGALIYKRGARGFLVRKKEKDYGVKDRLIGNVQEGDDCVIIEDVTTTGQSVLEVMDLLSEIKAKTIQVISVVDREQGFKEILEQRGVLFTPLVLMHQLIQQNP